MAKPPNAIGRAKKTAAKERILTRGQKKLAAKQARHAAKQQRDT